MFGRETGPSRITSSQAAAIGGDIAEIIGDSRGDAWAHWYSAGSRSWSEWRLVALRPQAVAITGPYGTAAAPEIPPIPEAREIPDGPGAAAELAGQLQELRDVLVQLRAAVTARPPDAALVIVTTGQPEPQPGRRPAPAAESGPARRFLVLKADGLSDLSS